MLRAGAAQHRRLLGELTIWGNCGTPSLPLHWTCLEVGTHTCQSGCPPNSRCIFDAHMLKLQIIHRRILSCATCLIVNAVLVRTLHPYVYSRLMHGQAASRVWSPQRCSRGGGSTRARHHRGTRPNGKDHLDSRSRSVGLPTVSRTHVYTHIAAACRAGLQRVSHSKSPGDVFDSNAHMEPQVAWARWGSRGENDSWTREWGLSMFAPRSTHAQVA